jgi:hypothetical protein
VTRSLLRAVHHFYTTVPLSEMPKGPAPDEVIALAKKYHQDDKSD